MERSESVILINLPGIAEIEKLACGQGDWLTDGEIAAKAAPVSVAVFGMEPADTYREVRRDLLPEARAAAVRAHQAWEANFEDLERDGEADLYPISYFDRLGFDITDDNGEELRCWRFFARQMIIIGRGLVPEAQVFPDGAGHRKLTIEAEAEEWGAALAREARTFKPQRR